MNLGRNAAKWLGCGAVVVAMAGCSSDKTPAQSPTAAAQGNTAERSKTARNDADTTVQISDEILTACQLPKTAQAEPHFDFADSTLHAHGANVLDDVARCAKDGNLRGRIITIIGHADPRGSTESNKELSAERAEGARKYMAEHGVASQNLRVIARGEADAHGDDEAGWKRDRRIDFELGPMGSDRAPTSNMAAKNSP